MQDPRWPIDDGVAGGGGPGGEDTACSRGGGSLGGIGDGSRGGRGDDSRGGRRPNYGFFLESISKGGNSKWVFFFSKL